MVYATVRVGRLKKSAYSKAAAASPGLNPANWNCGWLEDHPTCPSACVVL
ncbi:hypothetical protein HanPSC8_Chr09g0360971 [Helianthus annuus]|nr:hypothetical protein HanPSC8_Chr09g0360971 [Helianthus annuus]